MLAADDAATELALLVKLGADRYAVRADSVEEVCPLGRPVPVPRAPDFVIGVVNRHGRILTVVDIAHFLHAPPVVAGPASLVLAAAEVRDIGFVVDGIEAVEEVPRGAHKSVLTSRGTAEKLDIGSVLSDLGSFFD